MLTNFEPNLYFQSLYKSKTEAYAYYYLFSLTRGPSQLLPSDSALVLQYGSGPSSDFLAKILGVDTLWFLCNTQFYFPFSSLLPYKSSKRIVFPVCCCSSAGSLCVCLWCRTPGFSSQVICFFNHQVCNGCEGCKVSFLFQGFAFVYFLSSFIHI
jgi:hypothetical protein